MTRLINIEDAALLKTVADGGLSAKALWRRINAQPTIDAVPVIRCKECKWFGNIGCAVNIVDESDKPKENDYCSWAERKDNGADKRRR